MVYETEARSVTPETPPDLTSRLLRFLLPADCLACGGPLWRTHHSLGLCTSCRGRLRRWPLGGCPVCHPVITGPRRADAGPCPGCRSDPPPYDRLLAGWFYRPPLDAPLLALKYRRLEYLGAQLGHALGELLGGRLASCELVVPVPLHWTRRLERGYNQAERIARSLARRLDIPLDKTLRRRRRTPRQTRLSGAERRRNVVGSFAARRRARCNDRHVLLVDDVSTTGATLWAAAESLRGAGAREITALAVARAP